MPLKVTVTEGKSVRMRLKLWKSASLAGLLPLGVIATEMTMSWPLASAAEVSRIMVKLWLERLEAGSATVASGEERVKVCIGVVCAHACPATSH
ncbi:MAG: hypothetical protein OXU78_07130, partial [Deltaproteobacteria bacterium]|nr:hypothetical protein [Deltaproteobacteria bacterium]